MGSGIPWVFDMAYPAGYDGGGSVVDMAFIGGAPGADVTEGCIGAGMAYAMGEGCTEL